jgi:hypothetical protein
MRCCWLARACKVAELAADVHGVSGSDQAIAYLRGEGASDLRLSPFPDLIVLDLKIRA